MRYSIDRPPEDTFRHEFGHVLMGLKDGGTTDGMIRHTHPRAPSDMRAGVLWSNREFYTQGKLNLEKIPGLIRRVMGGIAADELFNNIPRSANHNLPIDAGGDGASAYKVLRGIGFTHEEAWEHMHRAIDQAKQYLTHPEVSRIIQENIATREPGLSTQYHYSPERLNSIHQELQRRINESGEPAVDYRRVSGAGSTGRAEAIAGAEGRATEAVRPTTKAAELTQDRVSTRVPRGKSPQENPLEGEPLLVGQDALAKALGFEKKIADKVQDYPGAKIPANVKDPAKIVKRHIDRMADNLKWP